MESSYNFEFKLVNPNYHFIYSGPVLEIFPQNGAVDLPVLSTGSSVTSHRISPSKLGIYFTTARENRNATVYIVDPSLAMPLIASLPLPGAHIMKASFLENGRSIVYQTIRGLNCIPTTGERAGKSRQSIAFAVDDATNRVITHTGNNLELFSLQKGIEEVSFNYTLWEEARNIVFGDTDIIYIIDNGGILGRHELNHETRTTKKTESVKIHTNSFAILKYSAEYSKVITASGSAHSVQIWTSELKELHSKPLSAQLKTMELSTDQRTIVVAMSDGNVELINLSGQTIGRFFCKVASISSVCYNTSTQELVIGTESGILHNVQVRKNPFHLLLLLKLKKTRFLSSLPFSLFRELISY